MAYKVFMHSISSDRVNRVWTERTQFFFTSIFIFSIILSFYVFQCSVLKTRNFQYIHPGSRQSKIFNFYTNAFLHFFFFLTIRITTIGVVFICIFEIVSNRKFWTTETENLGSRGSVTPLGP